MVVLGIACALHRRYLRSRSERRMQSATGFARSIRTVSGGNAAGAPNPAAIAALGVVVVSTSSVVAGGLQFAGMQQPLEWISKLLQSSGNLPPAGAMDSLLYAMLAGSAGSLLTSVCLIVSFGKLSAASALAAAGLALLVACVVSWAAIVAISAKENICKAQAAHITDMPEEVAVEADDMPEARVPGLEADDGAGPVRRALLRGMQLSDGTDGGRWKDEVSDEPMMRMTSQETGTRFPLFRGIAECTGAELRQGSAAFAPPTAAEVFSASRSLVCRQLADPTKGDDIVLERFGSDAWLTYSSWKGNALDSAKDGLYLQAVCRTPGVNGAGPRFTCAMVPAPPELVARHSSTVQSLHAGQSFKDCPLILSVVDIQSQPDGGLRTCCIVHIEPQVSWWVPSSLVHGLLRSVPLRGMRFLEIAGSLQLPNPIHLQARAVEEEIVPVQIAGKDVLVSKLIAKVVADRTGAS